MNVLIVDDEMLVRQSIASRIASAFGEAVTVLEAQGGIEALTLLRDHRPCVLLTDIQMPGMNGLDLIARVREEDPEICCVVLSGYAEFQYAQRAMQLGVKRYLLKPVSSEALEDTLSEALDSVERAAEPDGARGGIGSPRDALRHMDEGQRLNRVIRMEKDQNESLRTALQASLFPEGEHIVLALASVRPTSITFVETLRDRLRQTIPERLAICHAEFDHTARAVIALSARNALDDARAAIGRLHALYSSDESVLTLGVSTPGQTLCQTQFRQCREALAMRLLRGEGGCYYYRDMPSVGECAHQNDVDLLRAALDARDRAGVTRCIRGMLSPKRLSDASPADVRMLWVRVVGLLLRQADQAQGGLPPQSLALDTDVMERFASLEEFTEYLCELAESCMRTPSVHELSLAGRVELAVRYVRAHYADAISINDLACQYALSPNYFAAAFKKETGQNLTSFLLSVRMDKARELLRGTSMSVGEIAQATGYGDPQYFFRVFKRACDQTPLQYRRTYRAADPSDDA